MSVCIDDEWTVVDLIDYEQPEWPDWYELKALLERAARWISTMMISVCST